MITTINEFKKSLILEEAPVLNSDKDVKLTEYQDELKYYNTNKEKMKSLLLTKPEEKWEEEAKKIINGNTYLSMRWNIDKIERKIKNTEESLADLQKTVSNPDLSAEEKTNTEVQMKYMNNDLSDIKKELQEKQKDLNDKIKDDINNINRL